VLFKGRGKLGERRKGKQEKETVLCVICE